MPPKAAAGGAGGRKDKGAPQGPVPTELMTPFNPFNNTNALITQTPTEQLSDVTIPQLKNALVEHLVTIREVQAANERRQHQQQIELMQQQQQQQQMGLLGEEGGADGAGGAAAAPSTSSPNASIVTGVHSVHPLFHNMTPLAFNSLAKPVRSLLAHHNALVCERHNKLHLQPNHLKANCVRVRMDAPMGGFGVEGDGVGGNDGTNDRPTSSGVGGFRRGRSANNNAGGRASPAPSALNVNNSGAVHNSPSMVAAKRQAQVNFAVSPRGSPISPAAAATAANNNNAQNNNGNASSFNNQLVFYQDKHQQAWDERVPATSATKYVMTGTSAASIVQHKHTALVVAADYAVDNQLIAAQTAAAVTAAAAAGGKGGKSKNNAAATAAALAAVSHPNTLRSPSPLGANSYTRGGGATSALSIQSTVVGGGKKASGASAEGPAQDVGQQSAARQATALLFVDTVKGKVATAAPLSVRARTGTATMVSTTTATAGGVGALVSTGGGNDNAEPPSVAATLPPQTAAVGHKALSLLRATDADPADKEEAITAQLVDSLMYPPSSTAPLQAVQLLASTLPKMGHTNHVPTLLAAAGVTAAANAAAGGGGGGGSAGGGGAMTAGSTNAIVAAAAAAIATEQQIKLAAVQTLFQNTHTAHSINHHANSLQLLSMLEAAHPPTPNVNNNSGIIGGRLQEDANAMNAFNANAMRAYHAGGSAAAAFAEGPTVRLLANDHTRKYTMFVAKGLLGCGGTSAAAKAVAGVATSNGNGGSAAGDDAEGADGSSAGANVKASAASANATEDTRERVYMLGLLDGEESMLGINPTPISGAPTSGNATDGMGAGNTMPLSPAALLGASSAATAANTTNPVDPRQLALADIERQPRTLASVIPKSNPYRLVLKGIAPSKAVQRFIEVGGAATLCSGPSSSGYDSDNDAAGSGSPNDEGNTDTDLRSVTSGISGGGVRSPSRNGGGNLNNTVTSNATTTGRQQAAASNLLLSGGGSKAVSSSAPTSGDEVRYLSVAVGSSHCLVCVQDVTNGHTYVYGRGHMGAGALGPQQPLGGVGVGNGNNIPTIAALNNAIVGSSSSNNNAAASSSPTVGGGGGGNNCNTFRDMKGLPTTATNPHSGGSGPEGLNVDSSSLTTGTADNAASINTNAMAVTSVIKDRTKLFFRLGAEVAAARASEQFLKGGHQQSVHHQQNADQGCWQARTMTFGPISCLSERGVYAVYASGDLTIAVSAEAVYGLGTLHNIRLTDLAVLLPLSPEDIVVNVCIGNEKVYLLLEGNRLFCLDGSTTRDGGSSSTPQKNQQQQGDVATSASSAPAFVDVTASVLGPILSSAAACPSSMYDHEDDDEEGFDASTTNPSAPRRRATTTAGASNAAAANAVLSESMGVVGASADPRDPFGAVSVANGGGYAVNGVGGMGGMSNYPNGGVGIVFRAYSSASDNNNNVSRVGSKQRPGSSQSEGYGNNNAINATIDDEDDYSDSRSADYNNPRRHSSSSPNPNNGSRLGGNAAGAVTRTMTGQSVSGGATAAAGGASSNPMLMGVNDYLKASTTLGCQGLPRCRDPNAPVLLTTGGGGGANNATTAPPPALSPAMFPTCTYGPASATAERRYIPPPPISLSSMKGGRDHWVVQDRLTSRLYCWGSNAFGQLGDVGALMSKLGVVPQQQHAAYASGGGVGYNSGSSSSAPGTPVEGYGGGGCASPPNAELAALTAAPAPIARPVAIDVFGITEALQQRLATSTIADLYAIAAAAAPLLALTDVAPLVPAAAGTTGAGSGSSALTTAASISAINGNNKSAITAGGDAGAVTRTRSAKNNNAAANVAAATNVISAQFSVVSSMIANAANNTANASGANDASLLSAITVANGLANGNNPQALVPTFPDAGCVKRLPLPRPLQYDSATTGNSNTSSISTALVVGGGAGTSNGGLSSNNNTIFRTFIADLVSVAPILLKAPKPTAAAAGGGAGSGSGAKAKLSPRGGGDKNGTTTPSNGLPANASPAVATVLEVALQMAETPSFAGIYLSDKLSLSAADVIGAPSNMMITSYVCLGWCTVVEVSALVRDVTHVLVEAFRRKVMAELDTRQAAAEQRLLHAAHPELAHNNGAGGGGKGGANAAAGGGKGGAANAGGAKPKAVAPSNVPSYLKKVVVEKVEAQPPEVVPLEAVPPIMRRVSMLVVLGRTSR